MIRITSTFDIKASVRQKAQNHQLLEGTKIMQITETKEQGEKFENLYIKNYGFFRSWTFFHHWFLSFFSPLKHLLPLEKTNKRKLKFETFEQEDFAKNQVP